jgi:hypothetical protein
MRLLIPTIGTEMTLDVPWTFTLYQERRNQKFANDNFGLGWMAYPTWNRDNRRDEPLTKEITLPAGTILKVARIYVRSTTADFRNFDSVTFNVVRPKGKAGKTALKGRFWAKLADVNSMEVFFNIATTPIHEAEGLKGDPVAP